MPFSAGSRLGPYEIERPLGAGGMGEVYKARDPRLDRSVAIKLLPENLATDPARRARFEREARAIAALSHPNICAVHDIGSTPSAPVGRDIAYLVMEFVDGETLAARLDRGPMAMDQVVRLGREIADALAAAHRAGIVHRDLKPANIMVTRSGVKLLDFGLAKMLDPAPAALETATSLHETAMTSPGTVLGTVPYMSPEQVEGRGVDSRSDIFALGSVLYEMASGRRAFPGDSPAAVAGAILSSSPPPLTGAHAFDRVVRGCLVKDRDDRWQSAHDVALQLAGLADAGGAPPRSHRLAWVPWTVAGAAVLAAIAAAAWGAVAPARVTGTAARAAAFAVPPPPEGRFALSVEWSAIAVSPDGSQLAFASADRRTGETAIWLRPLNAIAPRRLAGTDGATSLFWSPDGTEIAFFTADRLRRIAVAGGAAVPICPMRPGIGYAGTWGADGQILFASVQGDAIMRVPASGGTPEPVILPDRSRGEIRVGWPSFLPDGRGVLYHVGFQDQSGAITMRSASGDVTEILRARSAAQYVQPGYLVFVHDLTLVARRFDAASGAVSGDPLPIADRVNYFFSTGAAQFSASFTGVIALMPHSNESYIAAFDQTGRELVQISPRGSQHVGLRLLAGGRELLFDRVDPRTTTYDVWRVDLDGRREMRVTSDPGTEIFPLLDGKGRLIFSSGQGGPPRLHRRDLATGHEEPLEPTQPGFQRAEDISADGRWLLYSQRTEKNAVDLHALALDEGTVRRLRTSPADEVNARFSPTASHFAYSSNESGRYEVYVMPLDAAGAPAVVSTGGGALPRWSHDGTHLYYLSGEGRIMRVPVRLTPRIEIGAAAALSAAPVRWRDFAVADDGRFVAIVPVVDAADQPLTVIVDWPSLAGAR